MLYHYKFRFTAIIIFFVKNNGILINANAKLLLLYFQKEDNFS